MKVNILLSTLHNGEYSYRLKVSSNRPIKIGSFLFEMMAHRMGNCYDDQELVASDPRIHFVTNIVIEIFES